MKAAAAPLAGRILLRCLPVRRGVVLENLRRAFGATHDERAIRDLAARFYAHALRSAAEVLRPASRRPTVRVENPGAFDRAAERGRGVLVLTGHLGNWELAIVGGIALYPALRGRFHVLRRPVAPPALERWLHRRFARAGLGVLPKVGGLPRLLDALGRGDAIVFVLDQHAGGRDGVVVDFFGHPASTFRSLAVIALSTGAPVVPLTSWRDPDGSHVVRFGEALETIELDDPKEAIHANTQAYTKVLEGFVREHPEQWWWVHRRWKG